MQEGKGKIEQEKDERSERSESPSTFEVGGESSPNQNGLRIKKREGKEGERGKVRERANRKPSKKEIRKKDRKE